MSDFDEDTAKHMMDHMNSDHVDAMHDYCRMRHIDTSDADPVMVNIDFSGFDLKVNQQVHRFLFDESCDTPEKARKALVALAIQSRQL